MRFAPLSLRRVLLLLPPSEGKAPPNRRGRPLALERLAFPELTAARTELLDTLAHVSGRPDALERLGVGASLAAEVEANIRLRQAPGMAVSQVYTGVLYDALGLDTLEPAARARATRAVLIFSGLWGVLRLSDRVPPYRLPIHADLPGLGGLAAWWRPHLDVALAPVTGGGVIVDCRSSGYAAAWTPPPPPPGARPETTGWVAVRVLRELDGQRSVVSHLAKHTRGQLARHLLVTGAHPRTATQLARAAGEAFEVELEPPARRGRPWSLDIVLREG